MSKGKSKKPTAGNQPTTEGKMSEKAYAKELKRLHAELVTLQQWVIHKGLKVCIVFEGRDGAGKGGTIKAITERVSPRVFRVVALPSGRRASSTSSAISATCPPQAKSSSSIAAGITGPVSSG